MSIQTELARITGAVGTQTDLIAQLMEALEGKAGNNAGEEKLIANYGVIETASKLQTIEIEHGLGVIPEIAVIFPDVSFSKENNQILLAYRRNANGGAGGCFCRLSSTSYGSNSANGAITEDSFNTWGYGAYSANTQTVKFGSGVETYTFKSGVPHYWIVAGGLT